MKGTSGMAINRFSSLFFFCFLMMESALFACSISAPAPYLDCTISPYSDRIEILNDLLIYAWEQGDFQPFIQRKSFLASYPSTMDCEGMDFHSAYVKQYPEVGDQETRETVRRYAEFAAQERKGESVAYVVPKGLEEFPLYLEGRRQLLSKKDPKNTMEEFPEAWKKLLELPPEQRKYRSIWVYYMMGNYLKTKEKHDCYAKCRSLADQGFVDSPGLIRASYRNEIRHAVDYAKGLQAAYNVLLIQGGDSIFLDYIKWLIPKIEKLPDPEFEQLLLDQRARDLLASLACSPRFLKMVQEKKLPLHSADRAAFRAYQTHEFKDAEMYLNLVKKETLLSLWVRSKLSRMAGDNEKTLQLLREWLRMLEHQKRVLPDALKKTPFQVVMHYDEPYWTTTPEEDLYGRYGALLVEQKDFVEAMNCFLTANSFSDAELIAERYMSMGQLKAYLESNSHSRHDLSSLRKILAQRAFMNRDFTLAQQFSTAQIVVLIQRYADDLSIGENTANPKDQRAIALYNASQLIYCYGDELYGHDGFAFSFAGRSDYRRCDQCKLDPVTWTYTACSDAVHAKELRDTTEFAAKLPPDHRDNHSDDGVKLALQAGKLAEDPHLRAFIYYSAGVKLMYRSPTEADVFYKLMIWKSWNTTLSRMADRMRWFPVGTGPMSRENRLMSWFRPLAGRCYINLPSFTPTPLYPNLYLLENAAKNRLFLSSPEDAKGLIERAFSSEKVE